MKIDLFGRIIEVEETKDGWKVFFVSAEGKKSPAYDIIIPRSIKENEIAEYLDDLYHEMATEKSPCVRVLR